MTRKLSLFATLKKSWVYYIETSEDTTHA